MHVIADPQRLALIEALQRGEQPVGALVGKLGIAQSGVSRHLRILHQAGVVTIRAQGQHRFYALRAEPFIELDAWLAQYRALWSQRLDRMAGALAARQLKGDRDE